MGNSQTRISVPPKKSEKILTISISLAVVECGENKISHFLWSIREKDDDFTLKNESLSITKVVEKIKIMTN